ncbi:hypothetical protein [Sporosarcina aquimarina]|uniref:hypothetical protein n=1 Tax=Sporosarcina aquimarina TaxID=114975 RepID=UPI001C8D9122|nr:hypothetical protein [Sporosarcina aquimarina]
MDWFGVVWVWCGTARGWLGTARDWLGTARDWFGTARDWLGTARGWLGTAWVWCGAAKLLLACRQSCTEKGKRDWRFPSLFTSYKSSKPFKSLVFTY